MAQNTHINRLTNFFNERDFMLEQSLGEEWLYHDMNFTLILYRVDKMKTDTDDIYGEAVRDGIKFLPPVEFKANVQVIAPENKFLSGTKINQMEPGNIKISVYNKHLEELGIDISFGDYIGYPETEDRIRYYTVDNDGRVFSDNKHTYGGYKPFYRTIMASPTNNTEFRGL